MRYLLPLILLAGVFVSCSTTKDPASVTAGKLKMERNDSANSTEVDAASGIDLTSFLRRIAGVSIRGNGPEAVVRIRGNSSFGTTSDPLYVVNGTILGTSFAALYTTVDPNEIARVTVLKSASETAEYGLRGGNGVIEIKLKK